MGKLILFKLESGNFVQGFDVTLQICEDNPEGITHPFTTIKGKLPPCQPITQHYQQWQESYRSFHQQVRLGSPKKQITNISDHCQESASLLKQTLSNWYHCQVESFSKIREKLLRELDIQESIRLVIQTDIKELRFLPWHLFFDSFLNQYLKAELAMAPIQYHSLKITEKNRENIRILAIFGHSQGINLTPDIETLTNLKNAEIISLTTPTREELFNYLYHQEWDVLFFAGHSGKNEVTWQGKLYLNDHDIITINELNKALKQAIQKGLKLAVFNSCDGLGLAQDLGDLHLSQIIVMGEMIPDAVAHVFIREFLHSFADNQPLYLAVRQAREKLQPLEKQFPCATWLPIICQNPATLPLTWQNLQGLDFNPHLTFSSSLKTPQNLANLILETTINDTQLTLEYNCLLHSNTEVIVNFIDIDLSMGEEITRILLQNGGEIISKELRQKKVKQLGQILTTGGGNLKIESIFHGVIYDYQNSELTNLTLIQTIIYRCLTLADSNGFNSLAFPVFLPLTFNISVEDIAITFASEIVNYLQKSTNLRQVKVVLPNSLNLAKNVLDERLIGFYVAFKEYLTLNQDLKTRFLLLQELKQIYQQRHMSYSVEILNSYEEYLEKFKEEYKNKNIKRNKPQIKLNYYQSLEKISQQVSDSHNQNLSNTNLVTSLHQNYNEKAAQIWQQLINLEDEEKIISLLVKLDTDIDAMAWINDQYELAIISATARQKKINEMLQTQIKEWEKGQQLLHQQILNLYKQGILNKKAQGKERNYMIREYPKMNILVKSEELPQKYCTEKISYTVDKKTLKEDYNNGIDISEFAEIDPNYKVKFGFIL